MNALYDTIGLKYAELRKPDARIARQIHAALGDARSVLNVGAGTGSYEPEDREVIAVEPSAEMSAQRKPGMAKVVQAVAEALPFPDKGCAEMRRVTRGPIVFMTFDVAAPAFWLTDYLPGLIRLDEAIMPPIEKYAEWLGPVEISPIPVPQDCTDGFLAAYWKRPAAYLDESIRRGSSSFWKIGDISEPLARLERDLKDGTWERKYGHLMERETLDCGYRLVRTI